VVAAEGSEGYVREVLVGEAAPAEQR
jgi:hypothetical protein